MRIGRDFILFSCLWVVCLVGIGFGLGVLTKQSIPTWYEYLKRSSLTPPNYVFGVAWTILYALIGMSGALLWNAENVSDSFAIKKLYVLQLLLNWIWTPIFFSLHMVGGALGVLSALIICVGWLIFKSYRQIRLVSVLLMPYFLWLVFAAYLNFFVWFYN